MNLRFYKYQGAGNDFILLDCREDRVNLSKEQISKMCERKFGIGADGLIYLESPRAPGDHFHMVYFNADGSESTMCGNGGRCIAKFAEDLGIVADKFYFHAIDGPHWAKVEANHVALGMSDAKAVEARKGSFYVDTGSPHHVELVETHAKDFVKFARAIRDSYGEEGCNVNSLVPIPDGFSLRTYERGVEDETLACGTGAVAAAMVAVDQGLAQPPVSIRALGGALLVRFNGTGPFSEVVLEGPATRSFEGVWEL